MFIAKVKQPAGRTAAWWDHSVQLPFERDPEGKNRGVSECKVKLNLVRTKQLAWVWSCNLVVLALMSFTVITDMIVYYYLLTLSSSKVNMLGQFDTHWEISVPCRLVNLHGYDFEMSLNQCDTNKLITLEGRKAIHILMPRTFWLIGMLMDTLIGYWFQNVFYW